MKQPFTPSPNPVGCFAHLLGEQRTRDLLDAILTSSADVIFVKDLEGRYVLANRACAEGLGLTVKQLLGRTDGELLPPTVAAVLAAEDHRVLAGESFVNLEQRLALPGGEGTYLVTKAPLRDTEGTIIGLYGIARDISARQRREADLRAAEATAARLQGELRWKEAFDRVGHGTWEWNIRTGRFELSPSMARLLGLEPTEQDNDLEGCLQRLHPDDRAGVAARLRAVIAGEQGHYETQYRSLHQDGGWRWFLSRGVISERGPDGAPWRMLGTLTDVTAWKEAEARLHETEERARRQWTELEAIYATAPVGLFVLDRDLRFLRLNDRLAEMNGLPVAAHLGRRVREVVPDLADAAEPLFQGVLDRGEPLLNMQLSGETASQPGVQRHWREHYYPMRDASGQVVGINGVVEEITEIKHIEAEIRALNADLEAKVAARTAEARAASAAKSEFLAHMSHEIRTPLNAVLGLVQVMEKSLLTPAQRELIERIRAAGRSLLLLLNDILDFSKIEAGQLQLEARPFVLAPLLHQLDALLGATARAKGLGFAIDAAPLPNGALVGDPLRLEQVLTNLIGNAVKFTDAGEVRLIIRTLDADDGTARLRFAVTDTGIGIAPTVLPQIFAAFNQADTGISRRFGGTGLGLAISKRLVEHMGGAIGVESEEGVGSTFWFELPLGRAAEVPTATVTAPRLGMAATPLTEPALRLLGRHYLIVDDNVLNLDVLERMLELEGARATRAGDGRQALERLRTQAGDFDAVLMDVQMPVLDGLSATRALRGERGLTRLPVIAITAGVLKEEQQRAREAGVDDLLPKPVELEHLVAVLRRWAPRNVAKEAMGAEAGAETGAETGADRGTDTGVDSSAGMAVASLPGNGAQLSTAPAPGERAMALDRAPGPASAPPGPPAAPAEFPALAGIDSARVAQLTRGDVAFFRRLLASLVSEARGVPARVREDLAHGADTEAAARLHRLRGGAANLGALDLVAAIRGLEAALGEEPNTVPAHLDRVEACLATVLTAAEDWLARTEQPAPVVAARPGGAAGLDTAQLAILREALAGNRPRLARQLFAELRPGLIGRYGPELVQAMAAMIDVLDFESALHALDAAIPVMVPGATAGPNSH